MKYYWCVNCGYYGDFGFFRQKNIKCQICEYDDLTEYEEEEYTEWAREFKHIQDEDEFYKSKGKVKRCIK